MKSKYTWKAAKLTLETVPQGVQVTQVIDNQEIEYLDIEQNITQRLVGNCYLYIIHIFNYVL